jgi:predicted transcriptional regulator
MAEAVGVSRKTIQLYEEGGGGRIDIIERIETFIQTAIVKPINPLLFSEINKNITYTESCNENEGMDDFGGIGEVFRIITSKGVKIIPLRKCPFDGVMIIGNKYLTTIGSKNELKVRTKIVFPVSRIIERIPLAIVTDQYANDSKAINGVPVITKNEMSDINESVELMDLIKMRIVKI